jgi:predicted RNA-binding Zn ribbon-like protein
VTTLGLLEAFMAEPRPAPFLIGDDLALDFLNSIATPWDQEIEWLTNGGDLVSWLEQAHAVPADVVAQFGAHAGSRALDAAASQAREMREWFRRFVRKHAGKPLGPRVLHDLAPLNEQLARDKAYRQIEIADTDKGRGNDGERPQALCWQAQRRWDSPRSLLLPIAEAMGDLVCQKDFTLVRKCEGPTCTLWFLDVSKGHGRRWCSMAACGNRAKAAAHRARVRGSAGQPD